MTFKKFLEKKNQGKPNKDVMMAVEEESEYNPSNILGILEKQLAKKNRHQNAHIDQVTQALKKEYKKNSFKAKDGSAKCPKPQRMEPSEARNQEHGKKSSQPAEPITKTMITKTPSTKTP